MPFTTYTFTKGIAKLKQLEAEITASSIAIVIESSTHSDAPTDNLVITMNDALTTGDETTLTTLVTDHTPAAVVPTAVIPGAVVMEETTVAMNGAGPDIPTDDGAICLMRGNSPNANLLWKESRGKWQAGTEGAEIDIALDGHIHDTADITTGSFVDARIAASNVTQHQASLVLTESQISDLQPYALDTTVVHNTGVESIGGNKTFSNNVTVSGDFIVNGTTTTVNTAELAVSDNIITLNSDEVGVPSQNSGIEVERGTSTNAVLQWNEGSDVWEAGLAGAEVGLSLVGHEHSAANVTSGAFANARISQTSVTQHQAALTLTKSQISDFGTYLTSYTEVNDLSTAVTWVNVPSANITQAAVTQHQAALSVTESQISDLGSYETAFAKNTAFNKDFGTITGTVTQGNDSRLFDARTPTAHTHVKANITDFSEGDYATAAQGMQAASALQNIANESINDLSNVYSAMAPADGQVLTFDTTNGWQSETPASGVTDHTLLSNIGTNTHTAIDTHIADATKHYTQASISITESQISDLGTYSLTSHTHPVATIPENTIMGRPAGAGTGVPLSLSPTVATEFLNVFTPTAKGLVPYSINNETKFLRGDGTWVMPTEANNLSTAVTWVNVPSANITQASVTQHQTALSITKSQVSDFGTYEPPITKNTGFNKAFGTVAGTVSQGNHTHSSYAVIGGAHHNSFSDYITEQHVDHGTINLIAGSGMVGGGTIVASRTFDVIGANSIVANANDIQLVNDALAPGNNKVYGTNASGVKGWKNDPTGGGSSTSHDRQMASSETTVSTTSTSYVDLSGMTLTTKNLGGSGTYVISFTANCVNSIRGRTNEYILNIGGSDVSAAYSKFTTARDAEGLGDGGNVSIVWIATGITNGTVIKVRWDSRDSGTAYTTIRRLVIDGILTTNVI